MRHSKNKSFIDYTFSNNFFSIKLWPVLRFLNVQVESKDSQVFQRCLLGRGPMEPKSHIPKPGTLFND